MIDLRQYQKETVQKLLEIILDKKNVVLNAEMRTGKTLTAIDLANELNMRRFVDSVLFITKKNAISSIEKDLSIYNTNVNFEIINYESLHKVTKKYYDMIIVDEYHAVGYIRKQKLVNKKLNTIGRKYFLGMTGTLFLETFSTVYSLFPWCFREYKSFYRWANYYVDIRDKRLGQIVIKDYTKVKDINSIMSVVNPYIVSLTQNDAGFSVKVEDILHRVYSPDLAKLCEIIKKRKSYMFKDGSQIVADSMSKEFQIIRQLQSGTLLMRNIDGDSLDEFKYLDDFKTKYIIDNFKNKKIAIYYEYRAEKFMIIAGLLREGYEVTEDSQVFNDADNMTVFIGQFVSKREGVNLSSCNDIIFFSMPYSNLSYIQARERAMTKSKTSQVRCHFLLTKFEERVYKIIKEDKGRFSSETYKQATREENSFF